MRRRHPVLSALLVGALVLGACGDSDDGSGASGAAEQTTSTSTGVAVEETIVVDERDGDTAAADDTGGAADSGVAAVGAAAGTGSDADADDADDADAEAEDADADAEDEPEPEPVAEPVGDPISACVVGTFLLDSGGFVAQIEGLGFDAAGGTATWEGGTYTTEFRADGTYTASRSGWTIRLAAPEGALVATFDGDQTGTWSAEDGMIDVVETADNSTMGVSAEVDGQVIPMPAPPTDASGGASISGSGSVTCDDAGMVISIDGIVASYERIG